MPNGDKPHFELDRKLCKVCGICVALCPKNALGKSEDGKPVMERPEQCVLCMFCETRCPDFAVRIGKEERVIGRV